MFMAQFTNFATLTYSGGTTNSNTVTGELVNLTQVSKDALSETYAPGDTLVYVIALRNTGDVAATGLTVTDDLGGYAFGGGTRYPLTYVPDSLRYYVNGLLQTAPTVTAGPPMEVTGLTIPAGGNALLIYEARVTDFAPLAQGSTIVNTATLDSQTAQETVTVRSGADLTITKALSPATVTENSRVTYTFAIRNTGNTPAAAADSIVVTDTFDPILTDVQVTYNGSPWTAGTQYTYNQTTGLFSTTPGAITVPAGTPSQAADGTWSITPGTTTLTISGII